MLQVFYFYAPVRNGRTSLYAVEAYSEQQARLRLRTNLGVGRCPNGTKIMQSAFFELVKM